MPAENPARTTPPDPLIAMVFDGDTGNAVDSFDYTPEELQRRADEEAGRGWFTIEKGQQWLA